MTPLVVTPGDPLGIGPEVTAKALRGFSEPVVVVGDLAALRRWRDDWVPVDEVRAVADGIAVLDPGDAAEPVEVASLRIGVAACRAGRARALVTGPIHKARLAARGFPHPGHTEFLAELCGVDRVVMAFVGGRVRVSLVTVHVPLREVPGLLDLERIAHTIVRSDEGMRDLLGMERRRIAVCGLNPHAGDGGLLGREDADVIAPAVEVARERGIDAYGPVSAEAAFKAAVQGAADWVVAMYHDQGLAPLKALEWSSPEAARAVNVTLGLPILRAGVDHGTADDIAGRGVADDAGMRAALAFAAARPPSRR